jgi:hypothetical protein
MTQRERNLSVLVAAAAALWGGNLGWSRYRGVVDRNLSRQTTAEEKLADAKFAVARGEKARKSLDQWRRQSLPVNREVAESLYQDWLRKQVSEAGLNLTQLVDRSLASPSDVKEEASVELHIEGDLKSLVTLLKKIRTGGVLQRVSSATIVPNAQGDKLIATLVVDALILKGCERTDALPDMPPEAAPQAPDPQDQAIVDRNLFAAYKPPAPPTNPAATSKLSGMTYGERGWRCEVRNESGGAVTRYYPGDRIELGQFQGTFVEADGRRAVIETSSGKVEVRLGQSFAEATKVEPPAS